MEGIGGLRRPVKSERLGLWKPPGRDSYGVPQSSRAVRSNRRRRSGSATASISTIFPPETVKPMTTTGSPSTVTTTPAAPFTSTGRFGAEGWAILIVRSATAAAPWSTTDASGRAVPPSDRRTTSGSRTATRASRSPWCAAAKKASTTARWRAISGSGARTSAPRTRRRARLASCLAVAGVRPTMGAISSKGRSNMSCRTNASRSAGASVSSTTCSARPTESASSASSSGFVPSARLMTGSGTCTPIGSSRRVPRERSAFRHTRTRIVVSQASRLSTPLTSAPLRRNQASWTASSASASEPSMR